MSTLNQSNPSEEPGSRPTDSQTRSRRVVHADELEGMMRDAERQKRKRRRAGWAAVAFLLLVGVIGAYVLTARYAVRGAREKYRRVYRDLDMSLFRTFNPAGLRKAEKRFQEVETMNTYLQPGGILNTASEALSLLRENFSEAQDRESAYQRMRERYNLLRKEAISVGLPALLPEQWAEVRKLEKTAGTIGKTTDFSHREAREALQTAIKTLEALRPQYDALRAYNKQRETYRTIADALNRDEWQQQAPNAYRAMTTAEKRAKAAEKSGAWAGATAALERFESTYRAHEETVELARSKARKALDSIRENLSGDLAQRIRRLTPERWQDLQKKLNRANEAFGSFRYETVESLEKTVVPAVAALRAELQNLQENRDKLLKSFGELYEKAEGRAALFRRNWPKRWAEIENTAREIRSLEGEGGGEERLLSRLRDANERLKAIIADARSAYREAQKNRKSLQKMLKTLDIELLEINRSEMVRQARERRAEAAGHWEAEVFTRAAAGYAAAQALLKAADEQVQQQRGATLALRDRAFGRLVEFQAGLRLFHKRELTRLEAIHKEVSDLIEKRDFAAAAPKLETMLTLLPEARFARGEDGLVTDFATGTQWITDGETITEKRVWYRALEFADGLTTGGVSDWRLPTRSELASLAALDQDERKTLFPDLPDSTPCWTSENVPENRERAFAVDLAEGTPLQRLKTEELPALPMRAPGK